MGGKTAMHLRSISRNRVEKLIVADMAPRAYLPSHDKIFAALLALDLRNRFQTPAANRRCAGAGNSQSGSAPVSVEKSWDEIPTADFFGKSICAASRKIIHGSASRFRLRFHLQNRRCSFAAANQIISIAEDEPLIHELFPQSQIQTIPDAAIGFTRISRKNF